MIVQQIRAVMGVLTPVIPATIVAVLLLNKGATSSVTVVVDGSMVIETEMTAHPFTTSSMGGTTSRAGITGRLEAMDHTRVAVGPGVAGIDTGEGTSRDGEVTTRVTREVTSRVTEIDNSDIYSLR